MIEYLHDKEDVLIHVIHRPVGVLGTSRLYRIQGQLYAFTPHFMDNEEFYLNADPDYLVSAFESELSFTSANWFYPGRPTMVVVLTHALLGSMQNQLQDSESYPLSMAQPDRSKKNLLNFFMNLRCGDCSGVRVRLCRLTESVNTSNIESLDFLVNQPEWENILVMANRSANRRRRRSIHRKLAYDEGETQANTPRTPGTKTPSSRRHNTAFHGKSLASPLDRLNQESYFDQISTALAQLEADAGEPRFKLKDPENVSLARKTVAHADSPSSNNNVARITELDTSASSSSPSVIGNAGISSVSDDQQVLSESPLASDMLSLVLGDPSQFQQAVESLVASVNLYDQIGKYHDMHEMMCCWLIIKL